MRSGDGRSPVQLRPEWRGAPPPDARVEVVSARGVDLAPLDVRDPATRERLLAFVWADDTARAARLEAALALAVAHPPSVEKGDAAAWLGEQLAGAQEAGVTRVVAHSIVLQYLAPQTRAVVREAIAAAGRAATAERPLAWISFEWDPVRSLAARELTTWPRGPRRELAACQAPAAWIEWAGG